MKNLVDLHAHILPGLDDGPQDLQGSLKMLEALEGMGFEYVFATPHHRLYSWEGIEPETVISAVGDLRAAAAQEGIGIKLLPGMEFDLDETLPERASAVPGGAGHILVDAGFWGVPRDLAGLLGEVMEVGAKVLLVHPERNGDLCRLRNDLSELIKSGVRLLGNIGSFSGMYGHKVQRDARDLLKEGFYWAVASDMHSHDQLSWIKGGMEKLVMHAGKKTAEELMATRPMQMVQAMEDDR
jgi:protein-tyrosine phosphatase